MSKDKKGFSLKSLIWNDGTSTEEKVSETIEQPVVETHSHSAAYVSNRGNAIGSVIPQSSSTGIHDPKVADHLMEVLSNHNLDGIDYFEFKNALKGMSSLSMADKDKIAAAFATLNSAQKLTKEDLVKSADHYIGIVQKEIESFNEAIKGRIETNVKSKENEVSQYIKNNEDIQKQIAELNLKMSENLTKVAELEGTISTEKIKIEQTKNNFNITAQSVIQKIADDKRDIELYINN